MPLQRGDLVPHFEVTTVRGRAVAYRDIWQQRNLVLIALPAGEPGAADRSAAQLAARAAEVAARNAACVITRDAIEGIPAPAAVVADRWGEIVHIAAPSGIAGLPDPGELLEWLDYVEHRCPECEGETR